MFEKIKNFKEKYTGIIIRLDDIAENMNWDYMNKIEILFDNYSIKPVLGVIPNNKDKNLLNYPYKENFWEKVRAWQKKGWEISMHGNTHVYENKSKKKDYFGYGGNSEFYGHSLEKQSQKIREGLNKFKNEKIKIRSFYAPNHTYDLNTFTALKINGINQVIDGYGLFPHTERDIDFIPQLFYKNIFLPFGIQSTQVHLNYYSDKEIDEFEKFIKKKYQKIITYDQALNKINNSAFSSFLRFIIKNCLKTARYKNQ